MKTFPRNRCIRLASECYVNVYDWYAATAILHIACEHSMNIMASHMCVRVRMFVWLDLCTNPTSLIHSAPQLTRYAVMEIKQMPSNAMWLHNKHDSQPLSRNLAVLHSFSFLGIEININVQIIFSTLLRWWWHTLSIHRSGFTYHPSLYFNAKCFILLENHKKNTNIPHFRIHSILNGWEYGLFSVHRFCFAALWFWRFQCIYLFNFRMVR